MIESVKNIFAVPDLRKRVLFTLGLLAVYRVGNHIPTPGVNGEALALLAEQLSKAGFTAAPLSTSAFADLIRGQAQTYETAFKAAKSAVK